MHNKIMLSCSGAKKVTGGYSLTRLTSILAALTASPGAPAKFAKEGLLGEALLALAGMSAVEVGRTHLTGLLIHLHLLAVLPGKPTFPPPLPPPCPTPNFPPLCPTLKALACVFLLTPLIPSDCCILEQRVRKRSKQGNAAQISCRISTDFLKVF